MKMHQAFALHCDVPAERVVAWNVAAFTVAAIALRIADWFGFLAGFLTLIAGMVAVTWVAIGEIERRIGGGPVTSRDEVAEEHERVAGLMAASRSMREAA